MELVEILTRGAVKVAAEAWHTKFDRTHHEGDHNKEAIGRIAAVLLQQAFKNTATQEQLKAALGEE